MLSQDARHMIVEEAREWVGTKYVHQHSAKGHAVDCVGLVVGVGIDLGLLPADTIDQLPNYSRTPNPEIMFQNLRKFLRPSLHGEDIDHIPDGSVLWLEWRKGLPMHLGIKATFQDRPTLIHSASIYGKCAEHDFSPEWAARTVSTWDYPGV